MNLLKFLSKKRSNLLIKKYNTRKHTDLLRIFYFSDNIKQIIKKHSMNKHPLKLPEQSFNMRYMIS